MKSRLPHLYYVTLKGYQAFEAGAPRVSPYTGAHNLSRIRSQAWLQGWDCAHRETEVAVNMVYGNPLA